MLAVELGSCWVRAARRGEPAAFVEPSWVARDANSQLEVAVGAQAAHLQAGAPGAVQFLRPIRAGRILDWEGALALLRRPLKLLGPKRGKPGLILAVPAQLSLVQRQAWKRLAEEAGARDCELLETPLSAALGCGCDVRRPLGRAVLDWGGGCLDMGLIAGGDLLYGETLPVGGLDLDKAVQRWVRQRQGLLISPTQAEEVKTRLLSALNQPLANQMEITGFGAIDGLPRSVDLEQQDLQEAVQPFLLQVREGLLRLLGQASPEVCGDILEEGIWLCGAASQLRGLKDFLEQISGLPVVSVNQPEQACIRGLSEWLRNRRD